MASLNNYFLEKNQFQINKSDLCKRFIGSTRPLSTALLGRGTASAAGTSDATDALKELDEQKTRPPRPHKTFIFKENALLQPQSHENPNTFHLTLTCPVHFSNGRRNLTPQGLQAPHRLPEESCLSGPRRRQERNLMVPPQERPDNELVTNQTFGSLQDKKLDFVKFSTFVKF